RVVELASEGEPMTIAERHVLRERDIPVHITRADNLIAYGIADPIGCQRWWSDAFGLEGTGRRPIAARQVRSADDVDTRIDTGADAAGQVAHALNRIREWQRRAAQHRRDTRDLPVIEHPAHNPGMPEPAQARHIVGVVDDEVVVTTDVGIVTCADV